MSDLPTVHSQAILLAQAQMKPTNMPNGSDSATLYKDGHRPTKVHSVDVQAWLNLGWSREPIPVESVAPTVPEVVPPVEPESEVEPEAAVSPVEETSAEEVGVPEPETIVPARRKRATDAIA